MAQPNGNKQGVHTVVDLRMFAVDAAIRLAAHDPKVHPQQAAADVYEFLMTGSFDAKTD